jgi:F-type H+-transporting ATPase subunit gamma
VSQRDVQNRIGSVKNIQKITRAMEMMSAARLRRAEQRISHLRPYAKAIRRMTRQAAEAAGSGEMNKLPILREHDSQDKVALLLITADRGLAGAFNAQILRAGTAAGREFDREGATPVYYATGRRGTSSLTFRGLEPKGSWVGFTERPAYANARDVAEALMVAYVDGEIDRVEMFYNGYVSPLTQELRRETLLPLQDATILEGGEHDVDRGEHGEDDDEGKHALVEYEPGPDEILKRLVPDYVEISIYRALLESAASELGARMTAMRNASENAAEVIEDLTLEMNRARQAEITQEIMEVVAGAEALS